MSYMKLFVQNGRRFLDASFGKHLMITNTVLAGGLFAIGDALQQRIEKFNHIRNGGKPSDWQFDTKRTSKLTKLF